MSGNWFGRNEYAFIENQYHETIEVKFDVQRSFTKRKSTGGKGGVGGFGVTIGGGGFTEEKIDWNIVKPGFTSLQPGHAIDRDTNLKGDVYLTVETNDKKVNICRWPVKSDTSWVITTRGELQQTKTKYKQPPPTETDSKNRESKRYQ